MKKLEPTTIQRLQEKIAQFGHESVKYVDPRQTRALLEKKMDQFQSSDEENKFVTIASVMNLCSAVVQITFGLILKSMSVISSAIDSLLDFVLGMFNLFLLTQSKRKRDETHNYGYGKLQGFGALTQGFVMLFFGIILAYFSIMKLTTSAPVNGIGWLIVIMILDFIGGVSCVAYYFARIKHSDNMIVIGTLKKLYAGLLFNVGILCGLLLIYLGKTYFDADWSFIDPLVGLIVAGYICRNAGVLLYDGYGMLMDKALPPEEIKTIKELIDTYQEDRRRWDALSTRQSGTTKLIEFTLHFTTKQKTFTQIYKVCLFLKKHLEDDIENSIVTIVPKPV